MQHSNFYNFCLLKFQNYLATNTLTTQLAIAIHNNLRITMYVYVYYIAMHVYENILISY